MKCKNCGRDIGNKKFCGYCGKENKKKHKYVVVWILIAVFVVGGIVGLYFALPYLKAGNFGGKVSSGVSPSELEESTALSEGSTSTQQGDVLSPESAVDIYMADSNIWKNDIRYSGTNDYEYGLLDLDFDGVLELICITDGDEDIGENKYYRIDLDTYTVERMDSPTEDADNKSSFAYDFSTDLSVVEIFEKTDGRKFYLFWDMLVTTNGEGFEFVNIYMDNDIVKSERIFSEYIYDYDFVGMEDDEYIYYEDGKKYMLSEEEYTEKFDKYFDNLESFDLEWTSIPGDEFDSSSDSEKRQQLLDAYLSFSYDGFSFDSVLTYDLPKDYNTSVVSVWKEFPDSFCFTSGVGAWRTVIEIGDDGTFVGEYTDSDMGATGTFYPKGTQYICTFSGKFTTPQKVNEYIYSMKIEKLAVDEMPNKEFFNNGIKYICSEPYGLDNADDFYIYLPGAPISAVEEGFMSWSGIYDNNIEKLPDDFYGLYNIQGEQGFVARK